MASFDHGRELTHKGVKFEKMSPTRQFRRLSGILLEVKSGAGDAARPGYPGKNAEWFQGKCKKALVLRFCLHVGGEIFQTHVRLTDSVGFFQDLCHTYRTFGHFAYMSP